MPKTVLRDTSVRRSYVIDLNGAVTNVSDLVRLTSQRTGNELPKHRQLINDRQPATTDLDGTLRTMRIVQQGNLVFTEDGRKTFKDSSDGIQLSLIVGAIPDVVSSVVAAAEAKCKSKYYGRLAEFRTPLRGQQVLGEIRETIGFIRSPWKTGLESMKTLLLERKKVVREINSLITGSTRSKKSYWYSPNFQAKLKALADLWLECRFVVFPLIQDIEDACKILERTASLDEVNSYRCYGTASSSEVEDTLYSKIYGVNYRGLMIRTFTSEHIIRFGYRTAVLSTAESTMAAARESFLNVRDIPGTVWELTPWSFLVDYFVNVGGLIESVFESQENVVWTSESTVNTREARYVTNAAVPLASRYAITTFHPCEYRYTERTVRRRAGPVGIPPLTVGFPSSNVRLANIAALLTGLLNSNRFAHRMED